MHNTHHALIEEIRDTLGIDDLDVDSDDKMMLKFDDQIVVIEFESEPTAVVKMPLGELPDEAAQANVVLRTVMAGQYMWEATAGATIGMDQASDSLIMVKRLTTTDFNGSRFLDELATLSELAARWSTFVADPNEDSGSGLKYDQPAAPLDHRAFI